MKSIIDWTDAIGSVFMGWAVLFVSIYDVFKYGINIRQAMKSNWDIYFGELS